MSTRDITGQFKFSTTKTVLSGDYTVVNESVVIVNKTVGAATAITLPVATTIGGRRAVIVSDAKGDAATNNITVSVASAGTINGASTYVISENYGSVLFLDFGTAWMAIAVANPVSGTELGYLNGVTAGTTTASKALVVDASKVLDVLTVTTLTAPTISGTTALTGRATITDGVTSGTARVIGGLAYSNTAASTAVTGTATETLFSTSYSMPANTLKAGTVVKIRFQGIATAANASDTLIIKVYIGGTAGTALLTSSTTDATANDVFSGEAVIVCRDAGNTGHFVASGSFTKVEAASGTATRVDAITASTVVDTTAAQVLGVSATWSSTNGGNSCRLDILTVEIA